MNDIKARMKSVQSTMQITKAMELVATSKLRRAKERVEKSRFFHEVLADAIKTIQNTREAGDSVWGAPREEKNVLYIVMAGDRGLAGGYNANVFRLTEKLSQGKNAIYLPVGKKAVEYYRHRKAEIYTDVYEYIADMHVGDTLAVLATGAYNYSMASNYNRIPRPAMVAVKGSEKKVIVRRETYEDIIKNDII